MKGSWNGIRWECDLKNKGITKCDKSMVICDVGIVQYDVGTVKCE